MISTRSRRTTRGRVPRYGRHGGGRGDRDGGHLHRPGAQLQHVLLQLHGAHVGRGKVAVTTMLCALQVSNKYIEDDWLCCVQ